MISPVKLNLDGNREGAASDFGPLRVPATAGPGGPFATSAMSSVPQKRNRRSASSHLTGKARAEFPVDVPTSALLPASGRAGSLLRRTSRSTPALRRRDAHATINPTSRALISAVSVAPAGIYSSELILLSVLFFSAVIGLGLSLFSWVGHIG
jgi:hypothetical protein